MSFDFNKSQIALAAAAVGAAALGAASGVATAAGPASKGTGTYVSGDFHNHTTCSDGSISMQKLVKKATEKGDGTFGLDWFVQAGSLATPAYPVVNSAAGTPLGPTTTWQNSNPPVNPKGLVSGTAPNQNMWRWQSLQEFQYPLLEYLSAYKNQPLFIGVESVVAGHEHSSMSVITGQMPSALGSVGLPATGPYVALGNATALAQWEYCFDRGDTDTSRGNTAVGSGVGNNWNCAVSGSANAVDASWDATAQKLIPGSGAGVGDRGHAKTLEALKWMRDNHGQASYYVPAHLERAGPFNPDGNNGYNIEHLRDFNNAAPRVAFGFETQPGHGASSNRGEYQPLRNGGFTGAATNIDSVGGTTYGGTGVYGAQVGGVWDALLGEGRNWWFFASSDWHNRGTFGPDDRRSTQDFFPGEYQRTHVLVRTSEGTNPGKLTPQRIVDGLRTGNAFSAQGQLIDRLGFVACASYAPRSGRPSGAGDPTTFTAEAMALEAAVSNSAPSVKDCATMGQKLVVRPGADITVAIVVRDPSGKNFSPYSFPNPSLAQIGVTQPLNAPVLDHIDVIAGLVTGYKTPGSPGYAGEWPRNTNWLRTDGTTAGLSTVPDAVKNPSAAIFKTFNKLSWKRLDGDLLQMSFRVPALTVSGYVRLRGSNLPPSVPFETDANGNPLSDLYTNANDSTKLKIPCNTVGTNVPASGTDFTTGTIDGCPAHLPVVNGQKYSAFDVAAWSDLWSTATRSSSRSRARWRWPASAEPLRQFPKERRAALRGARHCESLR